VTGLWTNDRDTLAEALVGYLAGIRALAEGTKNAEPAARFWAPRVAADLIDKRFVRVLDPGDTELVERVAQAIEDAHCRYAEDCRSTEPVAAWCRRAADAVIKALRQP
jgi:hypothetical protein